MDRLSDEGYLDPVSFYFGPQIICRDCTGSNTFGAIQQDLAELKGCKRCNTLSRPPSVIPEAARKLTDYQLASWVKHCKSHRQICFCGRWPMDDHNH
jgi:hypothetical protein